MKKVLFRCFLILILVLPASLSARGSREVPPPENQYRGKISVKGSEPHTWTALTDKDGAVYALKGPLEMGIREKYQGRTLTLEVTPGEESRGPGMPGELFVDKIIKVE